MWYLKDMWIGAFGNGINVDMDPRLIFPFWDLPGVFQAFGAVDLPRMAELNPDLLAMNISVSHASDRACTHTAYI
jgi:hypothetical protein